MELFAFKTAEDRINQIKAAARREGISASEWLRRMCDRALSGEGEAVEAARLRERVAILELDRDFILAKWRSKGNTLTRALAKASAVAVELERDMNRDHIGPILRGPEPDDDE